MAKLMKKRIQVFPISSDEYSARSADTSTRSTRSRIRLRNSSSKHNKRQQQLGLFGKRPYLYKAADQSIPTSQFDILYPNRKKRNSRNAENQLTTNHPIHWIDWLDTGMELFGCGITTGADTMSSEVEGHRNSSPHRHANGSFNNLQKEQEILAIKKRHLELMQRDYVQLHEDFFDSLLKEEGDQMLASLAAAENKISSTLSVGSGVSSKITTDTSRSVDAQHSRDGSGHTRTSTKSGPSISSTSAVRLDRFGSFSRKNRKATKTKDFQAYDERSDPATSTKTSKAAPESFPGSAKSNGKKSSSSALSIRDIMKKTHLQSPSRYLHSQCKLQKDKGKGDRLGSAISARGREPTLEKLRDKMKLIVEVSGELQQDSSLSSKDLESITPLSSTNGSIPGGSSGSFKAMSAGMKRRRAKISSIEHSDDCIDGAEEGSYTIETRSMIELQLGFLSMQYGLLLRWDAYRTGQVMFVCLRKMCNDSFYTKIRSPISSVVTTSTESIASKSTSGGSSSQYSKAMMKQHTDRPPRIIAATKKRLVTPPLVVRSPKGGNHAIYQRASGATEVVLVDAPYRVPHPDVFAPSILSLDVHRLTGLDPKSRWTLIMTFDGVTEIAHLKYNHRERVFETTRTAPCTWEISMMPQRQIVTSFDVATGLEIRLFEQRPKHRLRGGRSSSHVPAGSDSFSLTSDSNSYVIQNQRLIHYQGLNRGGNKRFPRVNSENSIASNNSFPSGSGSSTSWNSSKKSTSRLASTMTVPLGGLVCQPSTSQTTLWKLTIPFTHNEDAEVTLTLMHQSEYAHWLYQELRARRKEELTASSPSSDLWQLLVSKATNDNESDNLDDVSHTDDSDDTDVYCMEWLYYCCFVQQ